jgi:uncharacterized protein VirK/YbjX
MGEIQSQTFQRSFNASRKVGFKDSHVTSNDGLIPLRQLGKRLGFLRWLILLARQKGSWSLASIVVEFWRFLTHIGWHREVFRLLKLRPFDEIAQNNPAFAFKYVVPIYLARSFTVTERASCFLRHYRRLYTALPENTLRQILQGSVTLYEIAEGGNRFALTMGLPGERGHLEGELSLDLRVDGKNVFNLSFTIVPGWVVKSEVAEILLITRLQGTLGARSQIRLARKAFHEFFPGKLLLAALQGIADAFGISELEAVCATNQAYYSKKSAAIFQSAYDDFLAKVGMVKTAGGFYSSPIPIEGRLLASFKGRNRSRARKRRAIRQQIQSACAALLLEQADRAAHSASGAEDSTPVPGSCGITARPHLLSHTGLKSNPLT